MQAVQFDLVAATTYKNHQIEIRCYSATHGLDAYINCPGTSHFLNISGISRRSGTPPSQLIQEAMQWIDHSEWLSSHPGYRARLERVYDGWEWSILELSHGDWVLDCDFAVASSRDAAISASTAFVQRLVAWDALDLWVTELFEAGKLSQQEYNALSNSAHPRCLL